jgi:hypothetical protein
MKYFRVMMSSTNFCGFDAEQVFAAESEEALYDLPEYIAMFDEEQDLIDGHMDEDDYEEDEDANHVSVDVEEISEDAYIAESY